MRQELLQSYLAYLGALIKQVESNASGKKYFVWHQADAFDCTNIYEYIRKCLESVGPPISRAGEVRPSERQELEQEGFLRELDHALRSEPLEDGVTHSAEAVIESALSRSRDYAPEWIQR